MKKDVFYLESSAGFGGVHGSQDIVCCCCKYTTGEERRLNESGSIATNKAVALRKRLISVCETSDMSEVAPEDTVFSDCG